METQIIAILSFIIAFLAVSYLVPKIMEGIGKRLKKNSNYKIDANYKRFLNKLSKNDKLRRSLDKYSIAEIFIFFVLWLIFLINSFRITFAKIDGGGEYIGFYGLFLFITWFVMFLSSMGAFYYITNFIIRGVYKIINPHSDSRILAQYYAGMLNPEFKYSQKNLEYNAVRFDKKVTTWASIIFVISFIIWIIILFLR